MTDDDYTTAVIRAQTGDLDAYDQVVRRFQDMAFGFAYSVLGDFHAAEDAAQEAFLRAFHDLGQLRSPPAFPGWLRRIVLKCCDRITRRQRLCTVPLETATEVASAEEDPALALGKREAEGHVLCALRSLPQNLRVTTTLFYIRGYSHRNIAEFLEIPVNTVKSRLYTARQRLKERLLAMIDESLKVRTGVLALPERVRRLLELPHLLEIGGHPVREEWQVFCACFPDAERVDLDEICARDTVLPGQGHPEGVSYDVDGGHILRSDLTSQLFDLWMQHGGGPCQWVTAGRVFTRGYAEPGLRAAVHHQAEILRCGKAPSREELTALLLDVASRLLPGSRCRVGPLCGCDVVPDAHYYECLWRGRWLPVGGGGAVSDEWLLKAGLDPGTHEGLSCAFSLERCAQVRHDLDSIRDLWQPPYIVQHE